MKQKAAKPHYLHSIRILLFACLFLSLFLVKSVTAGSQQVAGSPKSVLAYATNVSISGLLSATNSYRIQNGLAPLSSNSMLNTSAQNKAQHMIDNDYWAHVAPDGTQPWYFFTQAGYNYAAAGENLAYGFDTSQSTVDAWMASPSHRANLLGNYIDVGFGIANGSNYQGGQNTVIVAHYGTPQSPPPPPPPAPDPTPPPAPISSTAPSSPEPPSVPPTASRPVDPPVAADKPSVRQDTVIPPAETKPDPAQAGKPAPVTAASMKSVSLLDSLRARQAPLAAIAGMGLTAAAAGGLVMTHRRLFRHALATGERFVIHHPALDFATVATVTVLILTSTVARIG